jgi:hypothetical protein
LGAAGVSRAGFGVAPKQSSLWILAAAIQWKCTEKVRDREDALTNTRDACALPETRDHTFLPFTIIGENARAKI